MSGQTKDVWHEATKIKKALEEIGWFYRGGGPYPTEPTLHFTDGVGNKLEITVKKTIDPE